MAIVIGGIAIAPITNYPLVACSPDNNDFKKMVC